MPRILVVEDSPTQARVLQGILESAGFEVVLAGDGTAALAQFQQHPFDLVISDILMPGLSGYEVCRRLKADPARGDTPVILLTTLSDPTDIVQGLECGADNFIAKPYAPPYLLERVRHMLEVRGRRTSKLRVGAEVTFLGRKLTIRSDQEQILDLLLTTFEDIVRTNRELEATRIDLAAAKATVEKYARELEGRVRTSENKYQRLMAQAQDAIFLLDAAGGIVETNRRAEELVRGERLVGRPFRELVVPPETEAEGHRLAQLLTLGQGQIDNVQLRGAGTAVVDVDLSATVAAIDGSPVMLILAHDITARRRLERQLRRAQKMEVFGQLAAGVAHDFNNLLTIINGYSEMVLGQLPPEAAQRGLIDEIHRAGQRAAGLTRQLLTFSRQQVVEPRVLDLNEVVRGTEKMLRRLIEENITLHTVLEPALGQVRADPGQVEQVIMNLAVNARDAMPQQGRLTLETANVELDHAYVQEHPGVNPGAYVRLAVSDTGHGMTAEVKTRLFEPFFTTKAPGKGTGLGLATVFGIVQQAGGHIEVYSEVARGTTFKVYFPRIEAEQAASVPPPRSPTPRGRETVLVVEDEPAVRTLTRVALQRHGYTILEAGNGVEALERADGHGGPIHLLVSDVIMPELGGPQLVEQLRQRRPGLKVLFVSGYTSDAVVQQGILEAEVAFLQKPFTIEALTRKVRAVLDGG